MILPLVPAVLTVEGLLRDEHKNNTIAHHRPQAHREGQHGQA